MRYFIIFTVCYVKQAALDFKVCNLTVFYFLFIYFFSQKHIANIHKYTGLK